MSNDKIRGELILAKMSALEKINTGRTLIQAGENELAQASAALRTLDKVEKPDVAE